MDWEWRHRHAPTDTSRETLSATTIGEQAKKKPKGYNSSKLSKDLTAGRLSQTSLIGGV